VVPPFLRRRLRAAGAALALAAAFDGRAQQEHAAAALTRTHISHTRAPARRQYQSTVRRNPIISTFIFNGGLIALLSCVAALADHYSAARAATADKKRS
jgi:hypothetical protein